MAPVRADSQPKLLYCPCRFAYFHTFRVMKNRTARGNNLRLSHTPHDTQPLVGTFIDEEFSLAPGISSTLRDAVNEFNFGVIQVQPTGNGAEISAVLAHEGNSLVFGLDVKDLI